MSQELNIKGLAQLLALPHLPQQLIGVNQMMARLVRTPNQNLAQPIKRLLRSPGKRLRPILVLAAAASQNHPLDEDVMTVAAAIELIHLSSLVHDDIIDEATTRRGQPTVNQQEGTARAILVGDFLLARATSAAAQVNQRAGQLLSQAFATMSEGQALELSDTFNEQRTVARYRQTIMQKTAALLAAACQAGALCAGAPDTTVETFKRYGLAFGMAFQLIDDVRDLTLHDTDSDKPVGNDLREGVYSLPILLALRGPQQSVVRQWLKQPAHLNPAQVVKTLQLDGSFQKTLAAIRRYNDRAEHSLDNLKQNTTVEGLGLLPGAYALKALRKTPIAPS